MSSVSDATNNNPQPGEQDMPNAKQSVVSDSLHEARVALRSAKQEHGDSYLHVGALLLHIYQNKLWKGAYENFVSFLRDEGISRSWGYRCMAIFERFEGRAVGILPDRLGRIAALQVDKETEDKLLICAREYAPGPFADTIRELKGLTPSDGECDHAETETRCLRCRRRLA